ncbi:MAG: hypothetical protein U0271_21490 [Polyangiaceae bacterium]
MTSRGRACLTAIALLVGCDSAPYDEILAGKACDQNGLCASGYVCDRARNVCVVEGTPLGGSGGQGSSQGGAGGGDISCTTASNCPIPENPCESPVCLASKCGTLPTPAETVAPLNQQMTGDCKVLICDGLGSTVVRVDNSDRPNDDKACTDDRCNNGVPENRAVDVGAQCSDNGGALCDKFGDCVECLVPSDCTALPPDDACRVRVCNAGHCEQGFTGAGTALPASVQLTGDCKVIACDGQGNAVASPDNSDTPDDGNDCTLDGCDNGAPTATPLSPNAPCAAGVCNATGQCTGCTLASDCGGVDTFCRQHTCVAGVCDFTYAALGTALPDGQQIQGNCNDLVCDGLGGLTQVADGSDVPLDDGVDCTSEACINGTPQHPRLALNAACTDSGGNVCDGLGSCVQCNDGSQCLNQGSVCQTATCSSHSCGLQALASGTPAKALAQTVADCQIVLCDGSGNPLAPSADDTDLPTDGDPCTLDQCVNGVPTFPPAPAGAPCGGGGTCDGAGQCMNANKMNGDPCTQGGQCASTHCRDGVCCDDDCGQACKSCLAADTGGADGQCDFIPAGQDPAGDCTGAETCDAAGGCAFSCGQDPTPSQSTCPAACTGGCLAGTCIIACTGTTCASQSIACPQGLACRVECGAGSSCSNMIVACPDLYSCEVSCEQGCNGATVECSTGLCDLTCGNGSACTGASLNCGVNACAATCSGSTSLPAVDCGTSCNCATCALGLGQPCTVGAQCATGNCPTQDGVCCDDACDGTCEACTSAKTGGATGSCQLITASTDPDNECTGTQVCAGGACTLKSNGQPCASGGECQSGFCPIQDGVCCGTACNGLCESCLSANTGGTTGSCASIIGGSDPSMECAGASTCNGTGACSGLPAGASCTNGTQCSSTFCPTKDKVCCDTPCTGACRSCRAIDTGLPNGQCGNTLVGLDPDNDCPGAATCGGNGSCN